MDNEYNEYHLATRKKDMLLLVATQLDFEHIMISQIGQRNTCTVYHLYADSKKREKKHKNRE